VMASEHAQARVEDGERSVEEGNPVGRLAAQAGRSTPNRAKTVESLRTRSGAELDPAPTSTARSPSHRYIVETIDKTLKPASKAKQVKAALDENARSRRRSTWRRAEEIRKGL